MLPDPPAAVLVPALACPAWCRGEHDEFLGHHQSPAFRSVCVSRADLVAVTPEGRLCVTPGPVLVRSVGSPFDVGILLDDLPPALAAVADLL